MSVGFTSSVQAEQAGDTLDVMTFNVRFDGAAGQPSDRPNSWVSTDGNHRRDLAISVIRDFDPDLLGVQEALANQVDDFSAALPGYGFYGVGRDDGQRAGEHSGIYFRSERFTLEDSGTLWLSETPEVPGSIFPGAATVRIASWVRLDDRAAGGPVFVLNTHWDHVSQAAREHGAGLIRAHLEALPAGLPVVVMGDLNVKEDNAAYVALLDAEDDRRDLTDAYRAVFPVRGAREGTFHGFQGGEFGARIDHVLFSEAFTAEAAAIVRTSVDGRFPSDHFPVTARLRRVPEPGAGLGAAAVGAALAAGRRR